MLVKKIKIDHEFIISSTMVAISFGPWITIAQSTMIIFVFFFLIFVLEEIIQYMIIKLYSVFNFFSP